MRMSMIAALLAATVAIPAIAQSTDASTVAPAPAPTAPTKELPYDRGYDKPSPRTDAINAVESPVTNALNSQANADAAGSVSTAEAAQAITAEQNAQYDADREVYWTALVKHDSQVRRDDQRYLRQQNAYASAMSAWRDNVARCKRGSGKACNAPTPNPADFY